MYIGRVATRVGPESIHYTSRNRHVSTRIRIREKMVVVHSLLLVVAAVCAHSSGSRRSVGDSEVDPFDPMADPGAVVLALHYRLTILRPCLVRIEKATSNTCEFRALILRRSAY